MNYENVFTISSSTIHFRGVYLRVKGVKIHDDDILCIARADRCFWVYV
jgi:hypothetical protein